MTVFYDMTVPKHDLDEDFEALRYHVGAHGHEAACERCTNALTRKMRSAREDDKALEYWAKYGCVSWGAGE